MDILRSAREYLFSNEIKEIKPLIDLLETKMSGLEKAFNALSEEERDYAHERRGMHSMNTGWRSDVIPWEVYMSEARQIYGILDNYSGTNELRFEHYFRDFIRNFETLTPRQTVEMLNTALAGIRDSLNMK